RPMLHDRHRVLRGAQFRRGVANAALDLLARGVVPGSTVALAAPITIEAVLVRYAAARLGCATVVCPNAADPARLHPFLADVAATDLLCFPETANAAAAV